MHRRNFLRRFSGFTLIELLVVIAIIAILSLVVIMTLNPIELLKQGRDANRVSDEAIINEALGIYSEDVPAASMGLASTVYISAPDTSTSCADLGLAALPTGWSYACVPSSTYRNVDGTGWIPVNFNLAKNDIGTPLAVLPVDPINTTSSGLYYSYIANGTQWILTAYPESQKEKASLQVSPQLTNYPGVMVQGSNLSLSPILDYNTSLAGWWSFEDASGSTVADISGDAAPGTWHGTLGGQYTTGKVGSYAGSFDGSTNYVTIASTTGLFPLSGSLTVAGWVFQNDYTSPHTLFPIGNPHAYQSSTGGWSIDSTFNSNGIAVSFSDKTHFISNASLNFDSGYQPNQILNQWTFITVVFDRTAGKVYAYVNGVKQSNSVDISSVTGSVTASEGVQMGDLAGWFMKGSMDDVRIYTRALSAAEIQALYNSEK